MEDIFTAILDDAAPSALTGIDPGLLSRTDPGGLAADMNSATDAERSVALNTVSTIEPRTAALYVSYQCPSF